MIYTVNNCHICGKLLHQVSSTIAGDMNFCSDLECRLVNGYYVWKEHLLTNEVEVGFYGSTYNHYDIIIRIDNKRNRTIIESPGEDELILDYIVNITCNKDIKELKSRIKKLATFK